MGKCPRPHKECNEYYCGGNQHGYCGGSPSPPDKLKKEIDKGFHCHYSGEACYRGVANCEQCDEFLISKKDFDKIYERVKSKK